MSDKYDETTLNAVLMGKVDMYKKIIKRNFVTIQDYVTKNIISVSDSTLVTNELDELMTTVLTIEKSIQSITINYDSIIEQLQNVNNKLSSLIKQNGTQYLEDMLLICYGEDFIHSNINHDQRLKEKFMLLNECCSVLSYKIVAWSLQNRKGGMKKKNNILEDIHISETSNTLDLHNVKGDSGENFLMKLYGLLKRSFKTNI